MNPDVGAHLLDAHLVGQRPEGEEIGCAKPRDVRVHRRALPAGGEDREDADAQRDLVVQQRVEF